MQKIITPDRSATFFNEKFQEHYHSKYGAKEEAEKKFVLPCRVIIEKKQNIIALDICFGLGYKSAALIDYMKKTYPEKIITIVGIENDEEIICKINDNNDADFVNYSIIKQLTLQKKDNDYFFQDKKINIKIILKDARESIKQLKEKFDVVFLDPFSPAKCPGLWTLEFIKDIYEVMDEDSILTTYSCARAVRNNLIAAGFIVFDGPSVGRPAPSTIARKKPV